MNTTMMNIFVVAAAMIVLLTFNAAKDFSTIQIPLIDTEVVLEDEKEIVSR